MNRKCTAKTTKSRFCNMIKRSCNIKTAALFIVMSALSFPALTASSATVEETFEYTGITELKVYGRFFDIQVSGHKGNTAEGTITIPQKLIKNNYIEVIPVQKGSLLEVRIEKKRAIIPVFTEDAIIKINAPEGTRIDLENSSGKIDVDNFDTDKIRLVCSSGSIKADDLSASITAGTSSGSIGISSCKGPLKIDASSGRVTVIGATGDIEAGTSSGAQRYENITGDITSESSSGSIFIKDQTGVLDLRASSGKLEGHGVMLKGDSSFVTTSGKISFDFLNEINDLSFDLSSGSGALRAGRSQGSRVLILKNGKINITGKSSSGSQTYR